MDQDNVRNKVRQQRISWLANFNNLSSLDARYKNVLDGTLADWITVPSRPTYTLTN